MTRRTARAASTALAILLLAAVVALPATGHHSGRQDRRIVEPFGIEVQRHVPVAAGYEPVPAPPHCADTAAPGPSFWQEDFEGAHGWSFRATPLAPDLSGGKATQNLWRVTSFAGGQDEGHSGPLRLYFGDPSDGDYDTGRHVAGSALSPPIQLPSEGRVALGFATKWKVEWLKGYDHLWVEMVDAAGKVHLLCTANAYDRADPAGLNGDTLIGSCSPLHFTPCPLTYAPQWEQRAVVLPPALAGQAVQIQLTFDSADNKANPYLGWMVDDLRLAFLAE